MKFSVELQVGLMLVAVAAVRSTSEIESQVFYFDGFYCVTAYVENWKTTSALLCAEECRQRPMCDSCAYVSSTGDCYIQAQTEKKNDSDISSADAIAYVTVSACEQFSNYDTATTRITWHPTGLEGDIACIDDYMYTNINPTVECNATGQWSMEGICKQKVWRNLQSVQYCPLPRLLTTGWAMCVRGTACTDCDKFNINLMVWATQDYIVHMNVRYDITPNVLVMNSATDGVWFTEQTWSLPPSLRHGEAFEVELLLLTDTRLRVLVNGTDTLVYQAPVSISTADVFKFYPGSDASLELVDLWSRC